MHRTAAVDRRAATRGVLAVLVALAIAVLGSGNLRWFDAALVGYLFGTLQKGEMGCPCHEGFFDATTGDVVSGPPQRPLGRIDVEVRNGMLWALAYYRHLR